MRVTSCLMLALMLLAGCSGSGTAAGGGDRVDNTIRVNLGTSTADHIISVADDALIIRHGYQFERRVETAEDIRLMTSWKELPATSDEKALGFGYARIRITVRARPRDRSAGTYAATLNAEIEGRGPTDDVWTRIPVTEERDDYFKDITTFFENEFKGGVRPGM